MSAKIHHFPKLRPPEPRRVPLSAEMHILKTILVVVTFALAFWACVEIGAGIVRAYVEIQSLVETSEEKARW